MKEMGVRPVSFRFQLSDWVLFSVSLPLQTRVEDLSNEIEPINQPRLPDAKLVDGSQGFGIRNLPIATEQPVLSLVGSFICYIPMQYPHCYIDLGWTFEQYKGKFSSKTRSTIQRKIRKFREYCDGKLLCKAYVTPAKIPEFFECAREVSKLSYQERLLDVGLPASNEFVRNAITLSEDDRLRAFILFHDKRPVAYLFCPEKDGVLDYAYLGYDPKYQKWSVGTILQWLAIEQIFREQRFRFFDFTEGSSSHKQLFATHQQQCANVFFIKKTWVNFIIIYSHRQMDRVSAFLGKVLERYGIKRMVKQFLRRS